MSGYKVPADLGRRAFLRNGSLLLTAATLKTGTLFAENQSPSVRIGLVTDLHYADKNPGGSRHYRETLDKLEDAGRQFQQDQPAHVVELGDFIDAADSVEVEKKYLRRINKEFAALPGQKHYVLGNHCVDTLTKDEFLGEVGQKHSYYSFDAGGFHFVVLDACFRSDGTSYGRKNFQWTDPNVSKEQLEWVAADLKESGKNTIVFVHQRLDVSNSYGVKNASEVRQVFEESGKVLAVFQGHSHKNDLKDINGIHYCVHRAMVEGSGPENNGYSMLDVFADGSIRVTGFREQQDYQWDS
ncbi:metallophosphoesterase [Rubinisphaera margarita]|uniref:metallophosphoesterase n=1 Tax=Rubinisphaera margarita TaxID=2909586 RepID=UPI001EE956BC|nr:metallophosphoesterase [Rubinisphaera margarita]MCG6158135.1 metallophosphoesterase [Rubinisphaera margarita]